ncbi:Deoxycytidine triphosphate deaminase [compost metagenome]
MICNVTPIEPEFSGHVVIEIANATSSPVRCYLEEGIAQFVFLQGDEACLRSYKDKGGKYMYQTGLTLAKV